MNYSNKAGVGIICMGAVLLSPISFAKQDTSKPGFYPSVSVKQTSDDNIFRQPATSETSDDITSVAPSLLLIKTFGKHQLTAEYLGDYASYDKNSAEDFTDHTVNFNLLLDLTKKFNIDLQANYKDAHEPRGSAGTVNASSEPNEYTEKRIFTGFSYGRKTAKAQFELDLAATDTEYTNNNQSARDRDNQLVGLRAFYNIGNKTALFVEAKQNTVDYSTGTLDSTENFYHLGLRWDASFKTTGEIKVGSFDKDFDLASQKDGDGTSYEASITWAPKTYSQFTLGLSRAPQESSTADNFYTSRLISLDWSHQFSDKLALNMNASDGLDEYSGGVREDKLSNAGLGFSYEFRRWMDIGLNYTYSKRDSTDNTADYTDNLVSLSVTFSK